MSCVMLKVPQNILMQGICGSYSFENIGFIVEEMHLILSNPSLILYQKGKFEEFLP
jgi:hypothetical protein